MDEIRAQSLLFLLAGYETTATALHFCIYHLALYPKMQQKALDEVNSVLGQDTELTYDHIRRLVYIEAIMLETLRLYPPAVRLERESSEDYEMDNFTVPKGSSIAVPVYAIHRSPEYYPDPEIFDPERFMPPLKNERDPLTFLAFGYGPRNCIGMRFAQMEIQLALAALLLKFKFVTCDKTEMPPIELAKDALLRPKNPIFLEAQRREENNMLELQE